MSWNSFINKQFIQDNDELKKELESLEDEELNEEGIISGPPAKQLNARWLNKFETLELTIEMTKDNVQYMVKPQILELK